MESSLTSFEICENGHRCENGSLCVENPYDEGNFYCDCDEVVFSTAFEGLSCEHEATVYCTLDQIISKKSFCTNGGECLAFSDAEEAHFDCKCPDNYEGGHCQYVKGTRPDGWPYNEGGVLMAKNQSNQQGSSGRKMTGSIIALIVIICCAFVSGIGYIIYKKKVKSTQDVVSAKEFGDSVESPETLRVPGQDLSLDADGSGLTESIQKTEEEKSQSIPQTTEDSKVATSDAEII
uniref:EGF-like domain-containing protein n=1 Tax=Eucampia antarctica TaxID=49252 RepID=A0A7S2SLZ0_9STRA|mmetsp:Transcript_9286/g.8915  ORF Transcript_9286/g.8915 Transcript_9286/m.8915 type:complete len:235 (+) Transcript_9286:171-875(+)|eukprot:CAMPEP_0197823552 /NCGR_PEP_ID=MMETSP1437-20131217/887_1 /TAXON_ID=49252 ORGANISM="Eucampia antarctica, Strain CCMP1452" /NCGR_SAMPLE_ID=MMETSP1437 /ASSEMBLY_ACC=CAM_ASM_001096 /LENGTH=234 /DNA_ID=CAMNT_0043422777 /DNA_START=100 /DNA_END=804 /DNA_ORIENTATION=-